MSGNDDFHAQYAAALQAYLDARDEDSLTVGHELGRRALQERISMLDIVEHHFRLILELSKMPESMRRSHWNSCCRRWPRSTSQLADFSTAPSATRNNGPAPRVSPIVTSSAPRW